MDRLRELQARMLAACSKPRLRVSHQQAHRHRPHFTSSCTLLLQVECMADDLDIPSEAVAWIETEARTFFESGGTEYPRPQGLEGAEIHAFFDKAREDARSSSAVMMAALAKTLGATPPRVTKENSASPTPVTQSQGACGCASTLNITSQATSVAIPADVHELLVQTVGCVDCWPLIASQLQARGATATLVELRAWQRADATEFRECIGKLGLKMGQRQRLLAALGETQHE
eukprot:scaffold142806_cov43-Tisochrysis_lutea.AAC.1